MLQQIIKLFLEKGTDQAVVLSCFIIVFLVIGFLVKEYFDQKAIIKDLNQQKDDLNKDKLDMSQDMLEMANDYNDKMIVLQRETSSTITSLMTMVNLMNK